MKQIAVFEYNLGLGGIQKALINLLMNLDEKKYQVDLYLFEEKIFYDVKFPPHIHIILLKKFPYLTRFIPFSLLKRMYRVTIDKTYDAAIDFNSYKMETAIHALQVKAAKRYIWAHNDVERKLSEEKKYRILWAFFKKKFYEFDAVCAVSEGVKKSIQNKLHILPGNIRVIPNYVDAGEILRKSQEQVSLEVDEHAYNVCILARLAHQKGIDIALNYWQEVIQKRKDIHLYIIGDGEDSNALHQQAANLKISDSVTFLGKKSNPFPYLNKMDALLLTSRYEGQGIVLLEAKVLGLHIIMSKHLEAYISEVEGTDDIVAELMNARKEQKHIDRLEIYNKHVLAEFDKLV